MDVRSERRKSCERSTLPVAVGGSRRLLSLLLGISISAKAANCKVRLTNLVIFAQTNESETDGDHP